MDRRTFITRSLGMATAIALPRASRAAQATSDASPAAATDLPALALTLTDTAFEIQEPLRAGRYQVTVSNAGTSTDSHFALGKIPDEITDAQYEEWLNSEEGETDALTFEDIAFVGVPDWPQPGGSVSGVVDLAPGRYFLFDPFEARGYRTLVVEGEFTAATEPASDLTVTLREMEIDFPETAFTTKPVRWKIENTGAMSHEVAVIPVSPEFTEEHLQMLFTLPEDATPPPGVPEFVYQPVAAIGILAKQHTSWLDVRLSPGHYLAACMLPFSTGYPHAMDGMYRFFDIE
jgi:hypothetical protein